MPTTPVILVVGDLLLDTYLWGSIERISPEAPVPIVGVEAQTTQLGGAGNVVSNLRSLRTAPRLVTVVGRDTSAQRLRELLDAEQVETDGLLEDPTRSTPEKTRVIAGQQQVLRFDRESVAPLREELEDALLVAVSARLEGTSVVILSDYGKGVLTPRVCQEVITRARQAGCTVLCDPKGADFSRYHGATAITPNRKEAALATGIAIEDEASLARAGRALRAGCDLEFLLITLGAEGMALFADGHCTAIPTAAREVFDVTGAGDTVVATLAYGLAIGLATREACDLANTAAAIVVSKFGAARATPEEIAQLQQPALTRQSARKVLELDTLATMVERSRHAGRRVVFTNGCFDLMHAGHVKLLEDAAALGDLLIVGLNSDLSVRALKGPDRPIQDELDRAALLAALASVDYVVLFDEPTPLALIERLAPDVLAKGQDYTEQTVVGAELVRERGGDVVLLPLMEGRSTSVMLRKIRGLAAPGETTGEESP